MAVYDPDEVVIPNRLWMGDLEPYMDEPFLKAAFAHAGFHLVGIKWVQDKITGSTARYCFLEFNDAIVTKQVLERLNNQPLPGTNGTKRFKLNWASRKIDSSQPEFNVFVADLSREVTSAMLLEYFQKHFKSVRYARVIEDDDGVSKGYGFVRFMDEAERNRCYAELDRALGLGKKPITIRPAFAPKTSRVPYINAMASVPEPDVTAQLVQMVTASKGLPTSLTSPSHQGYWPATSGYADPQYAYTCAPPYGYAQPGMPPSNFNATFTPSGYAASTTPVFVEDLEDPNPPIDPETKNREFYQLDKVLFTQLDDVRWSNLESLPQTESM